MYKIQIKPRGVLELRKKKRFNIRTVFVLLFIFYVIYTLGTQQIRIRSLANQEKELEMKLEKLVKKKAALKEEIELLHTDEYIEKVARDELGFVKSGEYIFKKAK